MTILLAVLMLIGSSLDFIGSGVLRLNDVVPSTRTCTYHGKARRFPVQITGLPARVAWQLDILERQGECVIARPDQTLMVRQFATSTGRIALDMPGLALFEITPRDAAIRDIFRRVTTEAPAYGFEVAVQRVHILAGEHTVQFSVFNVP